MSWPGFAGAMLAAASAEPLGLAAATLEPAGLLEAEALEPAAGLLAAAADAVFGWPTGEAGGALEAAGAAAPPQPASSRIRGKRSARNFLTDRYLLWLGLWVIQHG